MGDNTINSSSCSSPPSYSHHQAHISSFLFAQQSRENKMPFSSSYYPSPAPLGHGVRSNPPPPELDFDSPDCESEEGGVEAPEEEAAAKSAAAPVPGRCGSKRSRAAEVHNLSEKRRRNRINEKMKALQNLIPNSNKTDKASMLDEAIEYLKQLQLQVQMLSVRNGLNIHPIYLPEALQPLQVSQLSGGFGVDNGSAMTDMGAVGMLPLNHDSSTCNNTFDLPSHESIILPAVTSVGASETTFRMEPSHSRSFQLPVIAEEIFREDMVAQQQLDSGQIARNLSGNEIKTMAMATPLHFSAQASSIEHDGHLEACILRGERSGDVVHKDRHDNHHQIFAQQLDSLQRGRSFMNGDVKTEESSDF